MSRWTKTIGLVLCLGVHATGQTLVDLRTQAKSIDFAGAASTRPLKSGTALPSNCAVGEMYFKTDAPVGANLHGCTSQGVWSVETSSLRSASQLNDFTVTQSGTVLTIGAACALTTTCRVRFGNTSYSYSNSATVTLTAGSGTAYIYIASDGTLTVGHNLTLQCVNCVAQAGVTAFPPGSVPLANWTASNAAWVAGSDQRAFQSGKVVAAGVGLAGAESAGTTTLSLDTTLVGMRVSPPATAGDNCVAGSWATDTTFYYTCVSENTWRRAALGVW